MRQPSRTLTAARLTAMALTGVPLAGCNAAFLGNLVVMGLTIGIFVATLSLGRGTAARSRADASTATRSSTAHPSR